MDKSKTLKFIETGRVIAIVRGDYRGRESEIAAALMNGGVSALEVTLNSPGALDSIAQLAKNFGSTIAVGAGTALTAEAVAQAADAGASFIVSPNRNVKVIAESARRNLVSLPGCFTPSEIIEALDAGADAVKLFPAISLGPEFVRAIRGPMRDVRVVPTGGVTPQTGREYRKAGAWAIGVGSELVSADALVDGGLERLTSRAKSFSESMRDEITK